MLIRYLLSMRGRRLWAYEDADACAPPSPCGRACMAPPSAAALAAMVDAVQEALAFEAGLQVCVRE